MPHMEQTFVWTVVWVRSLGVWPLEVLPLDGLPFPVSGRAESSALCPSRADEEGRGTAESSLATPVVSVSAAGARENPVSAPALALPASTVALELPEPTVAGAFACDSSRSRVISCGRRLKYIFATSSNTRSARAVFEPVAPMLLHVNSLLPTSERFFFLMRLLSWRMILTLKSVRSSHRLRVVT